MSITTVRIDDDQLTDLAAQVAERLAGQTCRADTSANRSG
jgi:hypothetical protein